MTWLLQSLVIFLTFLAVMGWACWWLDRPPRVPVGRLADPAPLPAELPRAGRLELPAPNAGAADPAQQLAPVPWELAGAAYALGQQRARQDAVSAEVDRMCDIYFGQKRR